MSAAVAAPVEDIGIGVPDTSVRVPVATLLRAGAVSGSSNAKSTLGCAVPAVVLPAVAGSVLTLPNGS